MKIVIPTYKRETNQKAWKLLPKEIQDMVTVYTHSGRGELLKAENPGMNVAEFEGELYIPDVRQKCTELDEKVFIIDDQCVFYKRVYHDNGHVSHAKLETAEEYLEMFAEIEKELDNYFWVGCSPKASNTLHKDKVRSEATRSYSCYAINSKMLSESGVKFTDLYENNNEAKILEDFYVLLSMFSKGYPNLVLHNWVFDHKHGIAGGNSISRNNRVQEESQKELIKMFPRYVTQYEKEDASWVAEEGSTSRKEVRVAWKKCFDEAVPEDSGLSSFL